MSVQRFDVNVPLPHGTGNDGYDYALNKLVEPILEAFGPDVILVSAGQDAGVMDPLARMVVTKPGFESLGTAARSLARRYADGNLAIVQEGDTNPVIWPSPRWGF